MEDATAPKAMQLVREHLARIYRPLIDMTDTSFLPSERQDPVFLSRALAAKAVELLTGCGPQEAADSVVDGPDDFGIDAIAISPDHTEIWFVQAKWSDRGKAGFDSSNAAMIVNALQRLADRRYRGFNARIHAMTNQIEMALSSRHCRVHLVAAMAGEARLSPHVQDQLSLGQERFGFAGRIPVEVHTLGLDDFYAAARSTATRRWGRGVNSPARQAITEVTRRRLFDALKAAPSTWSGSLDEIAFLGRLYDLGSLPSFDPRFTTAEEDIVQHRFNNPEDWEDDWVFTDNRFRLADGPDAALLRFLAEMIHPAVRTDSNEVEYLLALINDALAPDGYQLRPASVISGYPVYEARRTSTRAGGPAAAPTLFTTSLSGLAAAVPATSAHSAPDAYATVREQAKGDRSDYNRARLPHPDSNQADVFDSTHKATGTRVAVKQLHGKYPPEGRGARMRREIEVGIALNGHPHTMPILDHGSDFTWFAMPWADGTAEEHQAELQDTGSLRALIDALTSALGAAHQSGWIHRDIKPSNILLLDGRWVLADWGAVRRPPGQTTKVGRTRLGIGTEGFTAPEIFTTNQGTPQATSDIYGVGRVIAWAVTGQIPAPNLPLLPATPGPWRSIVRAATQQDPSRRPQNIGELVALIERELTAIPESPHVRATSLVQKAIVNLMGAADALLTLLTDHADDYELYVDVLTQLPVSQAYSALTRDPSRAQTVLQVLADYVDGDDTHKVQFGQANQVAKWLCQIAEQAATQQQWDLLDEATQTMCIWDGAWDQWNAQERISPWLASLQGDAAAAVAGILRQYPDSAGHFSHLAHSRIVDSRIRQAVKLSQQ
ncbi:phosphotransferase [Streptomyces sp. NPDC051771]|uniref:AbiJ-related protein n=1 Tax=Streptomyces sp. NPDC051771 TaxID=3154847 RepID=UPI0034232044